MRDRLPIPSDSFSVVMFYAFASFYTDVNAEIHRSVEVTTENDRGSKKISRVETKYSPVIGEAELSLDRLN